MEKPENERNIEVTVGQGRGALRCGTTVEHFCETFRASSAICDEVRKLQVGERYVVSGYGFLLGVTVERSL